MVVSVPNKAWPFAHPKPTYAYELSVTETKSASNCLFESVENKPQERCVRVSTARIYLEYVR